MAITTRWMRDPIGVAGFVLMLVFVVAATGCAAGHPRFTTEDPAGFWMGLWHGAIAVITLIIGIFDDTIGVYERNNSGGWYDFGFILALTAVWGHSHHVARKNRRARRAENAEKIGREIETEIKRHIAQWVDAGPDEGWDEIGPKAEKKLAAKLREWAEDDRPAPTGERRGSA